jgi:pyridoxal/pyridoxine/pyridoxamine kinase
LHFILFIPGSIIFKYLTNEATDYMPKIICISSMVSAKRVGLPNQIEVLGSSCIAIPSVVQCLPGAEPLHRTSVPYPEMLETIAGFYSASGCKPHLFIGYMPHSDGIRRLENYILRNRHLFGHIICDPISGDNHKLYVNKSITEAWPALLSLATFASPNYTELALYSGLDIRAGAEECAESFADRFPLLDYAATGVSIGSAYGVMLRNSKTSAFIRHRYYDTQISGTGDYFISHFMKSWLIEGHGQEDAARKATKASLFRVKEAFSRKKTNLVAG